MVEERAVERVEEKVVEKPKWRKVFDDYRALSDEILRPDEPKKEKFLESMRKSLTKQNWPFLLPYKLTLEACTKCGTCAEACSVYIGSGRKKIYSPVYRSDMLRKNLQETLYSNWKALWTINWSKRGDRRRY